MPCPLEMDILQAEVGCNQGLVTLRNWDHGTVIPNADSTIQSSTTSSNTPADAGDQSFFREGQGAINIASESMSAGSVARSLRAFCSTRENRLPTVPRSPLSNTAPRACLHTQPW